MLNASSDIMIILNKDAAIWYCTDRVRSLGWEPSELLGMPVQILIPEEFREEVLTKIAKDIRTKGVAELVVPVMRKGATPVDLSLRWVEFKGKKDVEGAIILLSAPPSMDITSNFLRLFRSLLSCRTIEDLVRQVAEDLEVPHIDSIMVCLYNEELRQFSVLHVWIRGKDVERSGLIIPHNYTHLYEVVAQRRSYYRSDLQKEDHLFPIDVLSLEDGIRSDVSYPLIAGERVVGTLTVGSIKEDAFTPLDRNIIELLSDVISTFLGREEDLRLREARYRSYLEALETAGVGVMILDVEGRVVFFNDEMKTLLKDIKTSAAGVDLFPDDLRKDVFGLLDAALSGNHSSADVEIEGEVYSIHTIPIQGEKEVIMTLRPASSDIRIEAERSKRRAVEMELSAFRSAYANADEALIILDEEMKIMKWSDSATRLFGLNAEEMMGRSVATIFTAPPDLSELKSPVPWRKESELRRSGGTFSASLLVIPFSHGDFEGRLMHVRDVTNVKALQETLKSYAQKLEAEIEEISEDARMAEVRYRQIADSVHEVIYLRDGRGMVFYVNAAAQKTLKSPPTPPFPLSDMLRDSEISSAAMPLIGDARKSPFLIEVQGRERSHVLEVREENLSDPSSWMASLRSSGHTPQAPLVLGVARDVTERYEAEKRIEEYTKRLEERVKERTRDLEERNRQLEDLNRFLSALHDERTLDGAASTSLKWALESFNCDRGMIFILDESTGRMKLVASSGIADDTVARHSVVHPDDLGTRLIAQTLNPATVKASDMGLDLFESFTSTHLIPLVTDGEFSGVVILDTESDSPLIASIITHEVGSALGNLQKMEVLESKARILGRVREIQHLLIQKRDPDEIIETVLNNISNLIPCDVQILLLRSPDGLLQVAGVHPEDAVSIEKGRQIDYSIIELTEFIDMHQAIVRDLKKEKAQYPVDRLLKESGIRLYLAIPIVQMGDLYGTIYLCRKDAREFTRDDMIAAMDIADVVSVAVDNSLMLMGLKESEEKYETLVEKALDGIYIIQDDRFVYVNEPFARTFGYERDELIGLDYRKLVHPDSMEMVTKGVTERQRFIGRTQKYQFKALRKDGSTVFVEVYSVGVRYRGRPAVQGSLRDITELRKAELEIVYLKEFLEAINNSVPSSVLVADHDLNIRFVNKSFLKQFRLKPDQVVGKRIEEVIPEGTEEETRFVKNLMQVLHTGKPFYMAKWQLSIGDSSFLFNVHVLPLQRNDERMVVLVMEDVTESAKMEERLKESENRYRDLFENATDVMFTTDSEGRFTAVNSAGEALTGYSRGEWIGRSIESMVHEAERERVRREFERTMKGEKTEYFTRIITADGDVKHIWVKGRPILENGKVIGSQAVLRDVTAIMKEMESLREEASKLSSAERSARLFDTCLKDSSEYILLLDRDQRVARASTSVLRNLKIREEDLLGKNWRDLVPITRRKDAEAHSRTEGKFEVPLLTRDGSERQVEWTCRLTDEGSLLIGKDMTEIKNLRHRLEREAPIGVVVFRMNTAGDFEHVNGDVEKLLGFTAEEVLEIPYFMAKIVHPDDADALKEKLVKLIKYKEFKPMDEYRIVKKTGEKIWVRERCAPVYDASGKLIGVEGEIMDITEEKERLDKVRSRMEFYETILESLPSFGIIVTDIGRNVIYTTSGALELLGMEESAVLGQPLIDVFEEERELVDAMRDAIRQGTSSLRIRSSAGSEVRIEIRPMRKDGKMMGYLISVQTS